MRKRASGPLSLTRTELEWAPGTSNGVEIYLVDGATHWTALGFVSGDVIVGVDGVEFSSEKQMLALWGDAMKRPRTTLMILRGNQRVDLAVSAEELKRAQRGGDGQAWSILADNGDKHVKDNWRGGKPELFHLPDDVSESNDLAAKQPDRAKELHAQWQEWDKHNVPCRLMGYIDYHKERDRWYEKAIPERALNNGYQPKIKGQFK